MKNEKKKIQKLIENIVIEEFKQLNQLNEGLITDHPFLGGFIQPFSDILKTAKAELTKVTAIVFENTKKLAKQSVAFAIPFIGASAVKNIEKESQAALSAKIGSVNKQYQDVYNRTYEQFKNPDMLGFTFLLDPVLPLTKNFALAIKTVKDGGPAVLGLLEVLTGGNSKVTALKNKWIKYTKMTPYGSSMSGGGGGYGAGGSWAEMGDFGGFDGGGESVQRKKNLLEQQVQLSSKTDKKAKFAKKKPNQEDILKQMASEIQAVLNDPAVKQSVQTSQIVRDFQAVGIKALTNTIKPVMSAKTYEDLKKIVPDFNKIESEIFKQIPEENASPEQIQQWKQDFVPEFKQMYKNMFAKQIEAMLLKQDGKNGKALMTKILQQLNKM